MLFQPAIACRSCADCQKYMTDDSPFGEMGDFVLDPLGNKIERPPSSLPICRRGEVSKCPKGTPEKPKTLTPRNMEFVHYWHMVKAGADLPTDDWFWERAADVNELENAAAEKRQCDMIMSAVTMASLAPRSQG